MERVPSLILLGLAAGIGAPARTAAASTPKPVPVVATSFSDLARKVGQPEIVTAQFYLRRAKKRPQYVSGARLSVLIEVGTMKGGNTVLARLKGTTTDKQGKTFRCSAFSSYG
jgi:multidrug efflux pump subunit AcrA (membrane-fusion protein)